MDVVATVLPLVGVALGTLGTLTGQYLATRGAARRHADERLAAERAERKEAIVAFLDHAQRVEQVIDARNHGRPVAEAAVDDQVHGLWQSKKVVELVCSHELSAAAHAYVRVLHNGARGAQPEGDRFIETRGAFMEGARRELGVEGPPLYRV
jgi:hypothetical protein